MDMHDDNATYTLVYIALAVQQYEHHTLDQPERNSSPGEGEREYHNA